MNKSKEVASGLLVPGGDPPVLLDQVDEPLDLLALLVQMLVITCPFTVVVPPLQGMYNRAP